MPVAAVLLEPVDLCMFRDGRPFDAGLDALARSTRLPSPSTMRGAVLAALGEVRAITAPFLASWHVDTVEGSSGAPAGGVGAVELYTRAPLDLVRPPDRPAVVRLDWRSLRRPLTDLGWHEDQRHAQVLGPPSFGDPFTGRFLSLRAMNEYLQGDHTLRVVAELQDGTDAAAVPERHVGIALPRPGAETGLLYSAEFVRLHHRKGHAIGFAAFVHACPKPFGFETVVPLGGEGRQARLRVIDPHTVYLPSRPAVSEPSILVSVAAPAVFRGGWQPPLDGTISVPTAVVGDSESVSFGRPGRWALVRCVPAGSAYRLDFADLDAAAAYAATYGLHTDTLDAPDDGPRPGWCLNQLTPNLRHAGYGTCFLGVLP
jgi:CRISPR-associated protein Cmr3